MLDISAKRLSRVGRGLSTGESAVAAILLICSSLCYSQVYVDPPETFPPETTDDLGTIYGLAQQVVLDNNLFRLPSNGSITGNNANGAASRSDRILRTVADFSDRFAFGEQNISGSLRASYNRFDQNAFLNNFSTDEKLHWDWRQSALLSGQLEIAHDRSLLDFANTRVLAKDMLDTTQISGKGALQVSPLWVFTGSYRFDAISHGLSDSRFINTRNHGCTAGVEWVASELTSLELQIRTFRSTYPDELRSIGVFQQDFRDTSAFLLFQYSPSDKTVFIANGGYQHRRYDDDGLRPFSGYVWHAALRWRALDKLQMSISGGRDLNAYVDAAEEYFIAKGASAKLAWTPRDKLIVSITSMLERQTYTVGAVSAVNTFGRIDDIKGFSADVAYSPRAWLSFDVSIGSSHRSSSVSAFSYSDRAVLVGIKANN